MQIQCTYTMVSSVKNELYFGVKRSKSISCAYIISRGQQCLGEESIHCMLPLGKGREQEDVSITLETLIFQKVWDSSTKKNSDNSQPEITQVDTVASHSLVTWKLKGKGIYSKGWGNIVRARRSKGNFKDFFWYLLTPLSTFTQVKKMGFGNLYHQSFTKDDQTFLTSNRLQRGRKGIKQGTSSSSSPWQRQWKSIATYHQDKQRCFLVPP